MIYLELAKRFWPFILAALLFGTGYGYGHHSAAKAAQIKQDALQQEFAVFKANVQAQAIIAQKASDETKAKQEKEKQDADQTLNDRLIALNLDNQRLRDKASANQHYLPPAPANAPSSPTACLNRTLADAAIGQLINDIQSLTAQGDTAITTLNALKEWAMNP